MPLSPHIRQWCIIDGQCAGTPNRPHGWLPQRLARPRVSLLPSIVVRNTSIIWILDSVQGKELGPSKRWCEWLLRIVVA